MSPNFGQHGIRFREALTDGDAAVAISLLPELDSAHRVELILGAALRDGRDDFAAARILVSAFDHPEDETACSAAFAKAIPLLARPNPDRTLDTLAAAYVAERRVPDVWRPGGGALTLGKSVIRKLEHPDVEVARMYNEGVGGKRLMDVFVSSNLFMAVALYYGRGSIHALGPRPLLILSAHWPDRKRRKSRSRLAAQGSAAILAP